MQATDVYSADPVHMDPDGRWYFYDQPGTGRYGPFDSPELARTNLQGYVEWLHSEANKAAVASGQQAAPTSNGEVEQAVIEYLSARDEKAAIAERHKTELADVNDRLKRLDAFLLGKLQELGVDSVSAAGASVHYVTELQAGIGDKGALMDYIRESGEAELLQTRVSSTVLKEWMAAHDGSTPPGVTARFERVVRVRKN